ncbi:MAG: Asp23/Gls24 family envelope stress response protein [Clostridiales bacterium]|nr:Asp23/Gls24 family envelope stress response protein [Clostridiales bacterium]
MSDTADGKAESRTDIRADGRTDGKTDSRADGKADGRPEQKREPARDRLHIADEVLSAIAVLAVGRIPFAAASSAGVGDGLAGFLGMKNANRGVKIESGESGVSADLYVTVEYGQRINEVAKSLQDAVRSDIEDMTGLKVLHANVHVLGIYFRDAKDAKEAKDAKGLRDGGDVKELKDGKAPNGRRQLGGPAGAAGSASGSATSAAGAAGDAGANGASGTAGPAGPAGPA